MKPFAALALLLAAVAAQAETNYRAVYLRDTQVGYSTHVHKLGRLGGKPAMENTIHSIGLVTMGGQQMKSVTDSVSWATPDGRPLRFASNSDMFGTRSKIEAVYGPKTAEVDVENGGKRTHHSVPLPEGRVVDWIEESVPAKMAPGESLTLWTLNSEGTAFAPWKLTAEPSATIEVDGKKLLAQTVEATCEGTKITIYTGADGEFIRQDYPFGAMQAAVSKGTALALLGKPKPEDDMLVVNSLKVEGSLGDPDHLYRLKLRVVGMDLSTIPSDDAQTDTKDGDGWVVELHPTSDQSAISLPLANVAKGKEEWLKPSAYLPVEDPKIKQTAKKVIDGWPRFDWRTIAIQRYVGERMKYEIGFGETRDAAEILRKPKGQCTDYAILTTALLRAAGIPARVVAGLVPLDEGSFYYHAWSEAWDGQEWVAVDATADVGVLPAYYIKLSQGGVDEAFKYPTPPDSRAVKIKVLKVN